MESTYRDQSWAMIESPYYRYLVFEALSQLRSLRLILSEREYLQLDAAHLIEIMETVHDFLQQPLSSAIGNVLFDDIEVNAFSRLFAVQLDNSKFYESWPTLKQYMQAEPFQKYLDAAEDCYWIMLGEGRGIPGWSDSNDSNDAT